MNALDRALIEKAGCEHGWENVVRSDDFLVALASARHPAQVNITQQLSRSGWLVEVPGRLIRQELVRDWPDTCIVGTSSFGVKDISQLALLLRRTAELAQSLSNQAVLKYREAVAKELDKIKVNATEVECLVRQRVGQDTFRQALMDYWGRACAVTGLDVPEVLRASHAKPWATCESDDERLDVFNGFLLSANIDALFDRGLITFDDGGRIVVSAMIKPKQRCSLHLDDGLVLRWLAPEHEPYLTWHREKVFSGT
ncbi:MAG: HNH endonuclease [Chlorobium sp.]|nr:HNH endonuclease [Chlorobium sp.]